MTTMYPLTLKAPTTPASADSYRVNRVLTLDEEARQRNARAQTNFRDENVHPRSLFGDVLVVAVVTGIAWVLGHLGFWFLHSAVLLQGAVLLLSLHVTRRVFSLVHANESSSAAFYRLGQYQRYVTGADAAAVLTVALLGLTHLTLSANVFALAAGGAVAAVLMFRQISHRSFIVLNKRVEEDSMMEELTQGL